MRLNYSAASDLGQVRQVNEDRFLVAPLPSSDGGSALFEKGALFVVADGMGGANAGDQAAQITVEAIGEAFLEARETVRTDQELVASLRTAIYRAHDTIVRRSLSDPDLEGMGTTLVMLYLIEDKGYLFWVGDSRLYRLRKNDLEPARPVDHGDLRLLTDDHSVVWDDIISGNLSEIDARDGGQGHIITNCLGDPMHSPVLGELVLEVQVDDRYLMCSDGLNAMVQAGDLYDILLRSADVERTVEECIRTANAQGGKDNITAVLVDVYEIFAGNPFLEQNSPELVSAGVPHFQNYEPQVLAKKSPSSKWLMALVFLAVSAAGIMAFHLYSKRQVSPAQKDTTEAQQSSGSSIRMLEPQASDDRTNFFDAVAEIERLIKLRSGLGKRIENAQNISAGDKKRLIDQAWVWHEDAQLAKARVKNLYVDSEKKQIVNQLIAKLNDIEAAFNAAVASFEKEKERQEQLEIERIKKERNQGVAPKVEVKEKMPIAVPKTPIPIPDNKKPIKKQ